MKKLIALLLAMMMVLSMAACGAKPAAAQPETAQPEAEAVEEVVEEVVEKTAADLKICLISNQASGDLGPVDAFIAGAEQAEAEFGVTVKVIESLDAAGYEEDIRAMAKEGYDLILTTFPPMQESTLAVAKDYPDVKFAAIFQTQNKEGSYANIWSTDYLGSECTYVLGSFGATISTSGKLGYISGDESAGVCDACNGFMRGVRDTNPDAEVLFVSVDSYEDPAKAKEIANAMIAEGVDFIQTDCSASQLGVIEAAAEAGIYVSGDVSNNAALYPDGFASYLGIDFGRNVYLAIKYLVEGNFPGGEQGVMNLSSGTYFVDTSVVAAIAANNPDKADVLNAGKAVLEDVSAKIVSGEIVVESDLTAPSWDRIKAE